MLVGGLKVVKQEGDVGLVYSGLFLLVEKQNLKPLQRVQVAELRLGQMRGLVILHAGHQIFHVLGWPNVAPMGQKFVVYSIRVQPVFGGASLHTGEKQGILSIVVTQVDSNIVMRIVLNRIPIMSQQLVIRQAPIIQQNFLPRLYCFYTVDAHIFFSLCLGFLFKIGIHLLAIILSQCPHPDSSLLLGYDVLNLFIVIVVDELNFVAGGSGVVVQIVEARNEEVLARVPE